MRIRQIFPRSLGLFRICEYGWVLREECFRDYTGGYSQRFCDVYHNPIFRTFQECLLESYKQFLDDIIHYRIKFYDIGNNVIVQWDTPTTFRFRIADIDPMVRGGGYLFFELSSWLRIFKLKRRCQRNLDDLLAYSEKCRKSVVEGCHN